MEDQLHLFSAGSMNNEKFKNLWVQGAAMFIPQLNRLLDFAGAPFDVVPIEHFQNDCTHLGNLFASHRSDKSTSHNYHILYSYVINRLGGPQAKINLLEIGMGTNNQDLVSSMGWDGRQVHPYMHSVITCRMPPYMVATLTALFCWTATVSKRVMSTKWTPRRLMQCPGISASQSNTT